MVNTYAKHNTTVDINDSRVIVVATPTMIPIIFEGPNPLSLFIVGDREDKLESSIKGRITYLSR